MIWRYPPEKRRGAAALLINKHGYGTPAVERQLKRNIAVYIRFLKKREKEQ